ncbi:MULTISPECIES: tetratricopeptide repeat protein [Crocosphaera]|uniref:TPR repeat:TPR repeat n=3 Tax=Crocosphaera watsonii TaxID=263511 RepID=T2JN90_CROWT|nr:MULTISPECIES: tetratricopeptide repeat protein [Crocosphaera]EHJ13955.1 TPR repeat-containing protein [Crocosphaera watsonii WH 0003]MCH2246123.1 tetratricopeptide repeat protein [Crocosphaera sp.]NQZ60582.1 tetratricopeptide repeat protein [Crocosphaera sp.]CCQ53828.1 TPR repeat precursor [Crocosphaera watsonii WH 0005]CCQ66720.1 TPR repeat:TPR repeat [Crocosphaera watsonii WH 0402]
MNNLVKNFFKFSILIAAMLFCLGFSSPSVDKSTISPNFSQGIDYLRQEKYQEAIVQFTQVINDKSQWMAFAYSNRCLAHLQLNNNQAAKRDCEKALEMNSDNMEAYLNKGLADYRMENYHQSLAAYQEVIKRQKGDYRAYYNQGLVHFQLGNYQQALNSYDQALEIDQDYSLEHKTLIYHDRALAHLKLEDFSRAIANLTHLLILNPKNEQAYYQRGYAYQKSGDHKAAFQDFTEVITLNPQSTNAYINRGISAAILGFQDFAWQNFKIALAQFEEQNNQIGYKQTLKLMLKFKQVTSNSYQPPIG